MRRRTAEHAFPIAEPQRPEQQPAAGGACESASTACNMACTVFLLEPHPWSPSAPMCIQSSNLQQLGPSNAGSTERSTVWHVPQYTRTYIFMHSQASCVQSAVPIVPHYFAYNNLCLHTLTRYIPTSALQFLATIKILHSHACRRTVSCTRRFVPSCMANPCGLCS